MDETRDACPTDILVDLAIDGNPEKQADSQQAVSVDSGSPEKITNDENEVVGAESKPIKVKAEEQLCGYMNKVNQGGLIKGSKSRWFVFGKNACTLYYYRSPKETNGSALGSIPISNCAFTCTAEGLLQNSFQIANNDRIHILQACDQKTMLWWLQELQAERRVYNMSHNRHSDKYEIATSSGEAAARAKANDRPAISGLIDKHQPLEKEQANTTNENRDSLSVIPVLPRIENPPETVGLKSANMMKPKPSAAMGGLSEIGNKMSQIGEGITKMKIKPARPAPPVSTSVFYAKRYMPPREQQNSPPPVKPKEHEAKHKKPSLRTSARFSVLLDKVQSTIKSGGKLLHHDSKHMEEINDTLALVREEMELMKTSLESKEETIQLLKKELGKYSTISTFSASSDVKPGTEISSKDNSGKPSMNHQMRSEITALKLTIEHLREENDETKLLLNQQREKTELFQEMLQVKDGIVVQVTNELYEMERSCKSVMDENEKLKDQKQEEFVVLSVPSQDKLEPSASNQNMLVDELKRLKDEAEGYRLQNKFLNNEILELTHLRQVDEGKMNQLHDKILHQEAERCQLQSKYFILLAEMDRTRSQTIVSFSGENPLLHQEEEVGTPQTSVVKQLIQEAIREGETRAVEISASFRSSKYDKYGFTQIVDDGDESTFRTAASRLEQHASNILNEIEQHDASVALRWQKYFLENRELQRNAELKSLIRLGIPHEQRHKVWRFLVHARTQQLRLQLNADGTYYTRLTQTPVAPLHGKQIDLDLLRTLPTNRFFVKMDCIGIKQLKRVLGAYSLHNPSIGYCQGINRICAVALLYLSEEDAFWCLVAVVECIMPQEYYSSTLTASQADQRVFRDLLAEKMPRLHRHLETYAVDLSLITFNWFLCLYCDNVPPETMFRIWDVFLSESSKVLFRYGLAFFKHIEDDILELHEYMPLFNLLRRMVHRMYDARALSQIAFQGMNPFPMKKVERLRAIHMEKVRAELYQLDTMRQEFARRRTEASSSDMYSDDDGNDSS